MLTDIHSTLFIKQKNFEYYNNIVVWLETVIVTRVSSWKFLTANAVIFFCCSCVSFSKLLISRTWPNRQREDHIGYSLTVVIHMKSRLLSVSLVFVFVSFFLVFWFRGCFLWMETWLLGCGQWVCKKQRESKRAANNRERESYQNQKTKTNYIYTEGKFWKLDALYNTSTIPSIDNRQERSIIQVRLNLESFFK